MSNQETMNNNNALPNGWREVSLKDIAIFFSGGTPSSSNAKYYTGDIPFIGSGDIKNSYVKKFINEQALKESSAKLVRKGDLLYALYGATSGETAISKMDGAINQAVLCIRTKEDQGFLYNYLLANKNNILSCYLQGGQGNLSAQIIKSLKIILPPLPEQKAISNTLRKWNTAIEKTEALIAAKEKQFKWLLKTLISDQQNNPNWKKVKLGDICNVKKGEQLNKLNMIPTGIYPVQNGGVKFSGNTDRWNTVKDTITISEGGNSCGYVNLIRQSFWAGGHCYTLLEITDTATVAFLYYQLKKSERRIMKLRVGSGLPNIQKNDILQYPFFLPSIEKQKQIAHNLNTAQQEIDLLKKLAEQYRTQKRDLMQKLLTGQWRIKI